MQSVVAPKKKGSNFGLVSSAFESNSEESSDRIVVGKLNSSSIQAKLVAQGLSEEGPRVTCHAFQRQSSIGLIGQRSKKAAGF